MKLIIAIVVGCASVAHAQPSLTASAPPPPIHDYLTLGVATGIDDAGFYIGPELQFAHRMTETVWAHALGAFGKDVLYEARGTRAMFGGGLEARPCFLGGHLCAVAGVDLADRYAHVGSNSNDALVIGHVGIEGGTGQVRARVELRSSDAPLGGESGPASVGGGVATSAVIHY